MPDHDHLRKLTEEASLQRNDDASLASGADIGKRSHWDGMVNPNVPSRESGLVQRQRAKQAGAKQNESAGSSHAEPGPQDAKDDESHETSEDRDQKYVLIEQVHKYVSLGFRGLDRGVDGAMEKINAPELPKTDMTKQLMIVAATSLLGGGAGALAGWVATSIATAGVGSRAASTTSALIGGAITKAVAAKSAAAAQALADIKIAFKDTVLLQLHEAEHRFTAQWPNMHAALRHFTLDELQWINNIKAEENDRELLARIQHETMVAWTNFLARAKHGAMGPWDHWAENGSPGAIALPGAEKKPSAGDLDPTRNNIAPDNDSPLLDKKQRPMQEDAYGVLEIFVDTSGRIEDLPGYRMRLDNVGPKVRDEFRTSGKVRDLKVNKIVHICSHYHNNVRVDPPVSIASIMITADGHVRASNWSELLKVNFEPKQGSILDPIGFGDCSDKIIHGKETADCHIDRKSMRTEISTFANIAQELPLTWLEG